MGRRDVRAGCGRERAASAEPTARLRPSPPRGLRARAARQRASASGESAEGCSVHHPTSAVSSGTYDATSGASRDASSRVDDEEAPPPAPSTLPGGAMDRGVGASLSSSEPGGGVDLDEVREAGV